MSATRKRQFSVDLSPPTPSKGRSLAIPAHLSRSLEKFVARSLVTLSRSGGIEKIIGNRNWLLRNISCAYQETWMPSRLCLDTVGQKCQI